MNETPHNPVNFEDALTELERVVRDLEDGQIGLDESLVRYEQGVGLIKRCYNDLNAIEQRILQVTGTEADGRPTLQPFQHEATAPTSEGKRSSPTVRRRASDPF